MIINAYKCIYYTEQETEIQKVAVKPTGSAANTRQLADSAFDAEIPRLIHELLQDPEYTSIETQTTALPGPGGAPDPKSPGSEPSDLSSPSPNGCK